MRNFCRLTRVLLAVVQHRLNTYISGSIRYLLIEREKKNE